MTIPDPTPPDSAAQPPPPRAFTQGVGTVFQFTGVILFLTLMFVCCSSGLLSPATAVRHDLAGVGWGRANGLAAYSVPRAMTIALTVGIFCGISMAGLGLGLQATHRHTPLSAVLLTASAAIFYLIHAVFFATTLHSWLLTSACAAMSILFTGLALLAAAAWRDMKANPLPKDFEVLPADYQVPYSHLHADPPEVRIARELEQRKQRLAVQQKELELLEEKLKRKLQQNDEPRI
jgi:hypothetical protein